ncbi:hypothetical protein GCM10023235_78300 [Kitasatospora terrestris]|uniref:Uncharacterized protein n=1 Tax=Kitasatospora terrestris TaxID=258051 RepID=A0ABP9ESM4_9ACTN
MGPQRCTAARLDTSTAVRDATRRRIAVALDLRIHRLRLAGTTPTAQGIRASEAASAADLVLHPVPQILVRVGPGDRDRLVDQGV